MNSFESLGLSEISLEALKHKGFEEPTGIQEKIIPLVLNGDRDIIGQARTGTGKTAAFGLPILDKIVAKTKHVQALILVPTRELAVQVAEELNSLKGKRLLSILPVYGGQAIVGQIQRLRAGTDIVVGTPGRVIDHIERKTLDLSKLTYLILDEADEMLNLGFIDDIEIILKTVNPARRTLLFSATMPPRIRKIAETYMGEYEHIEVEKDSAETELTDQIYFEVLERDKFEALCRIVDLEDQFYGLVFCRTKVGVDELVNRLGERSYNVEGLHGDITQAQREQILGRFRKKKSNILVATDVAARGIDIENLSHVINFSLPQDVDSYIHRIGRTGRAGKEGTAITFVTPAEYRKLVFLKRATKVDIRRKSVPGVDDVLKARRDRILTAIKAAPETPDLGTFREMAEELLKEKDPLEMMTSVLRFAFSEKLDRTRYRDIKSVRDEAVDGMGKTRLSIQLGGKDGTTKRFLVDLIERETGVPSRLIKDVEVFGRYSMISVPFVEAERILKVFAKKSPGERPLVEKAADQSQSQSTGRAYQSDGFNRGGRPERKGGFRDQRGGGYKERGSWQEKKGPFEKKRGKK